MRRKIAAGNWKMHGTAADLSVLHDLARAHPDPLCDVLICPPAPLIHRAAEATRDTAIRIGAQDCHAETSGAHTGDVSARMLHDAGACAVILGHSERRQDHGESDADVRAKSQAAQDAGLTILICVGETLSQREADATIDVVTEQLAGSLPDDPDARRTVIAYEPIWAIGTGRVPDATQIAQVHAALRAALQDRFGAAIAQTVPLLYGGSVKGSNAASIFAIDDVDGALVGGASLSADAFSPIIAALESTG